jgi:hypothetical protein
MILGRGWVWVGVGVGVGVGGFYRNADIQMAVILVHWGCEFNRHDFQYGKCFTLLSRPSVPQQSLSYASLQQFNQASIQSHNLPSIPNHYSTSINHQHLHHRLLR